MTSIFEQGLPRNEANHAPLTPLSFLERSAEAVVFGELPKTSTGKIQKFELRKQAGSAAAIDV
jgi:acyl-coenzyme A synthetase/AMP-(fatty) acid ligase